MASKCNEKTNFVCRYGTFPIEVISFGLMNAPSTFHRMMDCVLRDLAFVRVYADEVLIFSEPLKDHVRYLIRVFELIKTSRLKIKTSKYSFVHAQTKLLGDVIGKESIEVHQEKISIIWSTLEPRKETELRGFLGLAGYYRRFIPTFAKISAPLHDTNSEKFEFMLTEEMRIDFQNVEQKVTFPLLLALPNFDVLFVVEKYASSLAVGTVLE